MPTPEQFRALFEPRGVRRSPGASTHPGKFGFVSLHNLLASGYEGACLRHEPRGRHRCWASTRFRSVDELPDGEADLVFVCTPKAAEPRPAAVVRDEGRPGGLPDLGRLRRGRRRGPSRRGRAGRPVRRAGDPAGRAQRTGRRVDAGSPVRADRGALSAGRAASASPASRATSCRPS